MATTAPTRALRPEKRDAILRAGRAVFARSGFVGATTEAIAAEAGVSTRTLYKHFGSKQALFAAVLETSARAVSDDYEAALRDGLAGASDPRERLLVLARAGTKQALGHPEHFAMVDRLAGEREHVDADVLLAWRKAGPDRVERATVAQLRALVDEGALEIDDVTLAARQFIAMTRGMLGARVGRPRLSGRAADAALTSGVDVFLRGYAPR